MNLQPLKRNQLSENVLSQIEFIENESVVLTNYWRSKNMNIDGHNVHRLEMLLQEYKKMIDIIDNIYNIPKREIPFSKIAEDCIIALIECPVTYERTFVIFYNVDAAPYLYF